MMFRADGENILTPGASFQAERLTRIHHKLIDGNEISREEHETIARDADGRFYDESQLTTSGGKPLPNSGVFHLVADPVAHTILSWSTLSQTALSSPLNPAAHLTVSTLQPPQDETSRLPKNSTVVTSQDLGSKTIAGLTATGKRTITTIPAGDIGNTRDLVVTHDIWTSTDLGITVFESDDSPISGTRSAEIVSVNRTAPSAELFQLPSGYTVRSRASLGSGVVGAAPSTPTPPQP
jgi:hypothetical protein